MELERNPELRCRAGKAKASRHHADDLTTHAVDIERAPDDARVGAKALPPELFADEHDGGGTLAIITLRKDMSHQRRNLEHGDERRRDANTGQALWAPHTAGLGDVRLAFAIDPNALDGMGQCAIGAVGWRGLGNVHHAERRHVMRRGDEAIGITIGKRAQQDAIHDGEDRYACADRDDEREDGRARECRRSAERAGRQPEILRRRAKPMTHALAPAPMAIDRRELAPRCGQIAELGDRTLPGALVRFTARDQVPYAAREVKGDLIIDVARDVPFARSHHATQPRDARRSPCHREPHALASRTRNSPSAYRVRRDDSARSCVRPRAVS